MVHSMQVIGFPESRRQSEALAQALRCPCHVLDIHHFPDGESRVTLPSSLAEHLVICRSLDHPNDKLVELLLCCKAARQNGVRRITLVAPYLCYLRQDACFHPGEVVSNRIIGEFLAALVDEVITVDAHLHRIQRLEQAIPARQAISLSAGALLGDFIAQRIKQPLVLGPDSESRQWVQAIAQGHHLEYGVADKQRLGDRQVEIRLPDLDYAGRHVVLVDDVVSTGQTLLQAVRPLQAAGAASISCLVSHALFVEDSYRRLKETGVAALWSTDSISHETNAIPLAGLLAGAVLALEGS
ncbi:MAG: phosphoribosylpyrophosphate synthetase [Gammaproteobacteria bacterium RBG_16_57_12]|nr:MAG: phosphoribosylpyrophosphate synthetase [Gammaproteobacteria bacterium RBG_16_57_12]